MFLARLAFLPIVWAFLISWGLVLLIAGGFYWAFTGEPQKISLNIGG